MAILGYGAKTPGQLRAPLTIEGEWAQ